MGELKFKVKDMLPSITMASSVINSKNALPILGDLKFSIKQNGLLRIMASDGEVWIVMQRPVDATEDLHDKKFCIMARDFLKAMRNIGDGDVTITFDDERHTFRCDYGTGHFTMPFEEAYEYPEPQMPMDDAHTLSLPSNVLLKAIEKTGFAVANDELRPVMNGIHFDFMADGMVTASSDGQKLAKFRDANITTSTDCGVPNFTLPAKPCNIAKNILATLNGGDVTLQFTDKCVEIVSDQFKLTARLIEGRFPNYNSVIPQTCKIAVKANRHALMNAVKRVLPMGNASSELISLSFDTEVVTVSAEDFDFSKSASERVICDYPLTMPPMEVGFKGSALLQVLTNLDGEDMVMELTEPSRAAVVYDNDRNLYLSLIMPMLIK